MPVPSYRQIADSLRQAIYDLATGKIASYSISGRSFTMHNLKDLSELEQHFLGLAEAEESGRSQYGVTYADLSIGE